MIARLRRTTLAASLAAAFASGPALADLRSDAAELAAMWEPTQVRVEGSVLTLVLPQRRITDQIYLTLLTAGLCLGPLFEKPLTGITEIRVLNQFGAQGYVYEKGLDDCATFNMRPAGDKMTEIDIFGATHLF